MYIRARLKRLFNVFYPFSRAAKTINSHQTSLQSRALRLPVDRSWPSHWEVARFTERVKYYHHSQYNSRASKLRTCEGFGNYVSPYKMEVTEMFGNFHVLHSSVFHSAANDSRKTSYFIDNSFVIITAVMASCTCCRRTKGLLRRRHQSAFDPMLNIMSLDSLLCIWWQNNS